MMLGSIYIGMSGLTAYSEGLKSVSNNVSNLNTSGFKTTDVSFGNIYGTDSNSSFGNDKADQGDGHGVVVDGKRLNFGQGELRQTNRDLDLAVDGNGFLVLLDGADRYFIRTGSFEVDNGGDIIMAGTDYRLALLGENGRPQSVNLETLRTNPPVPTTKIEFSDNISSTAEQHIINDMKVISADGVEHIWSAVFTKSETDPNSWSVKVTNVDNIEIGTETLSFVGGIATPATSLLTFEDAANGLSVQFDFSTKVTSFSSGTISTLQAAEIDGHATGTIATLTVNEKGHLEIGYTNEQKEDLGAIALADFREPQKLEQLGNGLFQLEGDSQYQFLSAEDSRVGTIRGKMLEASNVDLGREFGNLILIQRGFQASSQIISVSNDMIQQLFGIRGNSG